MQGVLLLLEPRPIGQDVVPLRLLPQIVELDQFAHRSRLDLLLLDVVKVLAEHAQSRLKVAAFVFRPERGRVARGHAVHLPPPQRLLHIVTALQQLIKCLYNPKVNKKKLILKKEN